MIIPTSQVSIQIEIFEVINLRIKEVTLVPLPPSNPKYERMTESGSGSPGLASTLLHGKLVNMMPNIL